MDLLDIKQAYAKRGWHIEILSEIKSGKDANVYKVKVNDKVAALKVYHSEKKHNNQYYLDYINIDKMPTSIKRSIKANNSIGKKVLQQARVVQEYKMLDKFYQTGISIPEPFATAQNTVLMEFIGDLTPAPRLIDVNLTQSQAQDCLDEVLSSIEEMLALNVVHADLSPFNILWHNKKPLIIDFPQALHIREHPQPKLMFERDIQNTCQYFQKFLDFDIQNILSDFDKYFEFL